MPYNRETNYKLLTINLTEDSTVTHAPTTRTILLQPPLGFVYEVIDIYWTASTPAGSSAGTHALQGAWESAGSNLLTVTSAFGATISIKNSAFYGDTEVPATASNQFEIIHNTIILASYDEPFEFNYLNSTDADQTGTRNLVVVVKVYPEAV